MQIPRCGGRLQLSLLLTGVVVLLSNPILAWGDDMARAKQPEANPVATKPCPVEEVVDDDTLAIPESIRAVLRQVHVMMVTMVAGPPSNYRKPAPPKARIPAPKTTIPLVVQVPTKLTDYVKPASDTPIFPIDNPPVVPEPTTLLTGLVGGGMALSAWVRYRRRRTEFEPTSVPLTVEEFN